MALIQSCFTCEHFDQDGYCALPRHQRKLAGVILEPESVVCSEWALREAMEQAIERAQAAGARLSLEERPLSRHPRY